MKRDLQKTNFQKRMTVNQHTERVRFDPQLVNRRMKDDNKYKLIFPRQYQTGGNNQDLYDKILISAIEMWKSSSGTNNATKFYSTKNSATKLINNGGKSKTDDQ